MLWAALVVGAVVVVDPSGLAPFGPAKWLVVPTLVLAATATSGAVVRVERRTTLAWAVFLLLVVLAAVRGLDPLYAWIGTPERRFGALAWVLCALAFVGGQSLDERGRGAVRLAVVATGAAVGLWAAAEALGWQPFDVAGAGDRALGPTGSSAYLGAAAALLLPAAAGCARAGPHGVPRWVRVVAASSAGVALVASGARAAWVGVLVAGAVAVAVRRRSRPPWRWVVGGAAVAVGLAVVTGVAGRVPDLWDDRDGGARGRLDEWRVAARVVGDHPLTGTGPEGYRVAFGAAVDDRYERSHGREVLPDRAHSAPLDVAATTGVAGAGAYLALVGFAGVHVVRALRGDDASRAGIATGLVAYATQSLFLFPIAELEPVAWLLAGTLVVPDGALRLRLTARAVAGVGAAACLVGGVLDVAADRRARSLVDAVADDRAAAVDATAAADLRPDAVRYRLVAARAFEAGGSLVRARDQLDRALDVSPRDPVARVERARLLLGRARQTGDPADARAAVVALADVARDDPRNAQVLLRLGLARQLAGDDPGAVRAWSRAEHLSPRSAAASVNLALAHAAAGRHADARAAARRALAREPDDPVARRILRGEDPGQDAGT